MTIDKKIYHAREALEKGFSFAQAVQVDNVLYIAGCLSWDENGDPKDVGDIEAQVRNVYGDLRDVLAAHGATFENVVKENIYTKDMAAMVSAAPIRSEFLNGFKPPVSTWVQVVSLVKPEFLLEVEMTAVLPKA